MKIVLRPHETMKQRRAQDRLRVDAGKVHDVVRTHPGIASKAAIAHIAGLSLERVDTVIRRINAGETGHVRLDYGKAEAKGGPHAGEVVLGWFVQNRKAHFAAMDHADEHAALTEVGVRYSRLVRFAQAHGIRGADEVVALIEERLGLSVEAMSEADLEAFEELLLEHAENGAEN